MPFVLPLRCGSEPRVARCLVILERHDLLRRSLARFFQLSFASVTDTSDPVQAEALIRAHGRDSTDVLCGQWLGDEFPPASLLVPAWRRTFSCLRRVVITNTIDEPAIDCDAADAICLVPIEPSELRDILLGTPR